MTQKQIYIVVGMAGTGKTSFCHRLFSWLHSVTNSVHGVNLDPAVYNPKMVLKTDIRDYVDYHSVMEKHKLGPNGAIITCLNLFFLKIDEFVNNLNEQYVIIDTPGQIEAFTYSAPGQILLESLRVTDYKINILYVVDSLNSRPTVFIANMLYAASLKCRFLSDVFLVYNKIDLVDEKDLDRLVLWCKDFEVFQNSLDYSEMSSTLISSLALYFEEFYNNFKYCFVSAFTDSGKKDFFRIMEISEDKKHKALDLIEDIKETECENSNLATISTKEAISRETEFDMTIISAKESISHESESSVISTKEFISCENEPDLIESEIACNNISISETKEIDSKLKDMKIHNNLSNNMK